MTEYANLEPIISLGIGEVRMHVLYCIVLRW